MKFNHNHDPANGRFTFGDGSSGSGTSRSWRGGGFTGGGGGGAKGSWGGGGFTGGGGGSGGGGGAGTSEKWGPDTAMGKAVPSQPASSMATTQALRAAASASGPQLRSVERNGYTYQLDAADRTRQVTGTLTLNPDQARSRTAQAGAGGSDRLPDDDGGHYIATRFNGPTDTFNHFAQNGNFNRGGYRVLENEWARDVKGGKTVYVAIVPRYDGSSKRPATIKVVYFVNGRQEMRSFPNSSNRKSHGR